MEERIEVELQLIRSWYPAAKHVREGHWVRIADYSLPEGWSRTATEVAFQIPTGYPGVPPYGIYVPSGLLFEGVQPDNYTDLAPTQPPFTGSWALFSWAPVDGEWRATTDPSSGSNLLNWISGFSARFREGK